MSTEDDKLRPEDIWYNKYGNCVSGGSIAGPYKPPAKRINWKKRKEPISKWKKLRNKIFSIISYIIPIYFFKKYRKNSVYGFATTCFPLIKRTFPNILAKDIVSVQKMDHPTELIFELEYTGNNPKDEKPIKSCF